MPTDCSWQAAGEEAMPGMRDSTCCHQALPQHPGEEREEPLGGGDQPPALGSFISSAQVSSSHSAHGCDFSARASEEVNAFVLFSVMTRISLILCTVTWKLGRHKYIKAALKKRQHNAHNPITLGLNLK